MTIFEDDVTLDPSHHAFVETGYDTSVCGASRCWNSIHVMFGDEAIILDNIRESYFGDIDNPDPVAVDLSYNGVGFYTHAQVSADTVHIKITAYPEDCGMCHYS